MSEAGFESVINWVSVYGVWLPSLSLLTYQCLNKIEYRVSYCILNRDIWLFLEHWKCYRHEHRVGRVKKA